MATHAWSFQASESDSSNKGLLVSETDDHLVVAVKGGGKVTVAPGEDGHTISVEGDLTLRSAGRGALDFVGGADFDLTGATVVRGKLVLNLSSATSVELGGDVDANSGEVRAQAAVTIRF